MVSKYNINNGIKKFLVTILAMGRFVYHKTPTSLRFIFFPVKFAFRYLKTLRLRLKTLRLRLWMLTGQEIISKHELVILYAGGEKNKNYFVKLAFEGVQKEEYLGKTWLWKLSKIIQKNRDCSLIIAEVHEIIFRIFFQQQRGFYIPCWISGELDISVDISSLTKNRGLKSDLSHIRKKKLDFEITHEQNLFHDFYHNMYVPYTSKVHGNRVFLQEYNYMEKEKFRNGDLLLLKKEQEYIAGLLITYAKDKAYLWSSGIKDGNIDYIIKDRAKGALYYFSLMYMQKKGFKTASFGKSRAFLNDGVLQYKKKWGIHLVTPSETGFFLHSLLNTEEVKEFLLRNPFIYLDKKNFHGALFVEADQPFSQKIIRKLYNQYYLTGMAQLVIYQFGEQDHKKIEGVVPSELKDKIIVRSAETLFPKR